jgi:N-formylglutamate amidohydrolase
MDKINLRDMLRNVSPILIKPASTSITVSLSKRFFLFNLINKAIKTIEEDPHLNFISLLKSYKVLGRILYGTVHELHRDRNKMYFKNFFVERELWKLVRDELEWLVKEYKNVSEIKLTLTKRGVMIFDNYKKDSFNVLLMTIHSGTWAPKDVIEKMKLTPKKRYHYEDIETHKIYSRLVLEKGGIWIDNKLSRFACDFNRNMEKCIYGNDTEWWISEVWKEPLSESQVTILKQTYREFYFTLSRLLESYRFNIIFDGHSMWDSEDRPRLSFGTQHIPKFYMPIVKSMHRKLVNMGYSPAFNKPYKGGYILKWLSTKFPDLFIFSMEINKVIYTTNNHRKPLKRKIKQLSKDLSQIFNIEIEDVEYRKS